jgi:ribosome-binding factor A
VGSIRLERLNSLIAETVAELLQRRSKDPRLAPVTISQAKVSPNLKSARVFYGVLGGDSEREQAAKALERAKGFIRASLFELLSLKRIPEIRFELDLNPAHAARVSELLSSLAKSPDNSPVQESPADSQGQKASAEPSASGGPSAEASGGEGLSAASPQAEDDSSASLVGSESLEGGRP